MHTISLPGRKLKEDSRLFDIYGDFFKTKQNTDLCRKFKRARIEGGRR